MSDSDHSASRGSPVPQCVDFSAEIAALHKAGANQFDPVGLYYLEVLARRLLAQQESVRPILENTLAQALAAFAKRFAQAQCAAMNTVTELATQYPHANDDLQQLLKAADFNGLKRFISTLKKSDDRASLDGLTRYMAQHAPEPAETALEARIGSRPELKTMRYFRNTWSKLSIDKQVTQALGQAPKNAGPINSHMLVLRSLALMRDISPDYLNRFMTYADTLLCLDQCDKKMQAHAKEAAAAESGKKIKVRRSRTR